MTRALALSLTLAGTPALTVAATPPLLPFDQTGDLYVLDDGCDCVLRIDPSGAVSVAVTRPQIEAVTGDTVDFTEAGIAFDANDVMYFTESTSDSILRFPPGGPLAEVVDEAAIGAATGAGSTAELQGLAFGADGNLYANDQTADVVIRVVPGTGVVSVFATAIALNDAAGTNVEPNTGIVGSEDGTIYTLSDDGDDFVFAVTSTGVVSVLANGNPPFNDLDVYMTRDTNGDLVVADNSGADTIFRITPAGTVSVFLTQAQIRAASSNNNSDLEGGIAFDATGAFYIAENDEDEILRFASPPAGGVFVSAASIQAVTGEDPAFNGGIAFSRSTLSPINPAPAADTLGILFLMLGLGLLGARSLRSREAPGQPAA
jgi:sugar lactone lactonase YvrE